MTGQKILILVALLALATAVIEPRHPPKHHNYHHDHSSVPDNLLDPEVAPKLATEQLAQEEIVKDNIEQQDVKKEVNEEPRKNPNLKCRREETVGDIEGTDDQIEEIDIQVEETENELKKKALWVNCDYTANQGILCYDCRTRLICKYPGGGKLIGCNNALKPYCNNGYCSSVASDTCS